MIRKTLETPGKACKRTFPSDFQVELPREVRESLGIQPGQKIQVLLYNDRIEFIPVKPLRQMRGFLEGIDTTVERENDRV